MTAIIRDQQPPLRPSRPLAPAPVIWISGFSSSGKTTVGRVVEQRLRGVGMTTALLDGDDLRAIFAGRWGYTRVEREDLARIYIRLCSHLASQGITVVLCAVAMYDEVRGWLREHLSSAIEVFLDVPEQERRKRDSVTKSLYGEIGAQDPQYDVPRSPDLVVPNHSEITPERAAERIVDLVTGSQSREFADHGRRDHWNRFYRDVRPPTEPSSFAQVVADNLTVPTRLLEVGCGNGRDARYFASLGLSVLAIDKSADAIAAAARTSFDSDLEYLTGSIDELAADAGPFSAVYSRFCLHAMTQCEEDTFLARAADLLHLGGALFIECRSINDPLARCGEFISGTERIFGHYRRFVQPENLRDKLESLGFTITSFVEAQGLTPLGDDDPVVIRVHATVC